MLHTQSKAKHGDYGSVEGQTKQDEQPIRTEHRSHRKPSSVIKETIGTGHCTARQWATCEEEAEIETHTETQTVVCWAFFFFLQIRTSVFRCKHNILQREVKLQANRAQHVLLSKLISREILWAPMGVISGHCYYSAADWLTESLVYWIYWQE